MSPKEQLQDSLSTFVAAVEKLMQGTISPVGFNTQMEINRTKSIITELNVRGDIAKEKWDVTKWDEIALGYSVNFPIDLDFEEAKLPKIGGVSLIRLIEVEIPMAVNSMKLPPGSVDLLQRVRGIVDGGGIRHPREAAISAASDLSKTIWWKPFKYLLERALMILVLILEKAVWIEMKKLDEQNRQTQQKQQNKLYESILWKDKLSKWFKDYLRDVVFDQAITIGEYLFSSRVHLFGSEVEGKEAADLQQATLIFDHLMEFNRSRFQQDVRNVLLVVVKEKMTHSKLFGALNHTLNKELEQGTLVPQSFTSDIERKAKKEIDEISHHLNSIAFYQKEIVTLLKKQ